MTFYEAKTKAKDLWTSLKQNDFDNEGIYIRPANNNHKRVSDIIAAPIDDSLVQSFMIAKYKDKKTESELISQFNDCIFDVWLVCIRGEDVPMYSWHRASDHYAID